MSLSPARAGKIGSSTIAALFGRSRWHTRLQLWHSFVNGAPLDGAEDERMRWGRMVQPLILEETARRQGWEIEGNQADSWIDHPDPSFRAGCTLDAKVLRHERGLGIVECKAVDRLEWQHGAWAGGKPPMEVELQLQHQLWVTGAVWGAIAVLIGGNELAEPILREPKPRVHRAIERELRSFWREHEERQPPKPEGARDNPILLELLPLVDPDEPPLDASQDLELAQACADLETARTMYRQAKVCMDAAEGRILARAKGAGEIIAPDCRVKITKTRMEPAQIERKAHYRKTITIKQTADRYEAAEPWEYRA